MEVGVTPPSQREERVNEVIAACLADLEAGRQPNPEDWLRRHSDLAAELSSFFADKKHFECLAHPFRPRGPRIPSPGMPTISVSGETSQREADTGPSPSRLGDYELLEELGRGGMGVVYKARQISQWVHIKNGTTVRQRGKFTIVGRCEQLVKINFVVTGGFRKGDTCLAVYERHRDTIQWCGCYASDGHARPSVLATEAGDNYFLRALKRTTSKPGSGCAPRHEQRGLEKKTPGGAFAG